MGAGKSKKSSRIQKEDKAGLYITLIVHLVVLIVLLIAQIDATRKGESSFILDFTKQEELEKQQQEAEELEKKIERAEQMRAAIQAKIDSKLAELPSVKNVTVNKGALKDDRGTNVKELMKEAQRVQDELKRGYKPSVSPDDVADPNQEDEGENKESDQKQYSGASVLSWQLDGRNAVHLKIPAYKCYGGGTETVMITVDRSGRVIDAKIQDGSGDKCLVNAAIAAAKASRFSSKSDAPEKQIGNIVYQFIPQ